MTNQQIANQLKSQGFKAVVSNKMVKVSLNRQINSMEVQIALMEEVPEEMIARLGNRVVVFGTDS